MKDQRPCLVQRVMEHFRDATSVGRVSQRVQDPAYTDYPRHTLRHISVPPILTMEAPFQAPAHFFRGQCDLVAQGWAGGLSTWI